MKEMSVHQQPAPVHKNVVHVIPNNGTRLCVHIHPAHTSAWSCILGLAEHLAVSGQSAGTL